MAVTKLTMSGFKPSTFNKYDDFLAGNAAYDPAATWLIQRITATGGETSITFSGIPSTYKHLQIRWIAKDTSTASDTTLGIKVQFNSDTGTNYAYHELRGDGTSATTNAATAYTGVYVLNSNLREVSATSTFGTAIVDIHDYASTSKNKTVRYMSGMDKNTGTTASRVSLGSGLWLNTNAITSITMVADITAFKAGTTFALYGFTG